MAGQDQCHGKKVVSAACKDCHGTGRAIDAEKTRLHGKPIDKECARCKGVGYSRMPASAAYRAVTVLIGDLPETTWRRNFKPLYELLVAQCHKEESFADSVLSEITR